jgi:hypothetical protein
MSGETVTYRGKTVTLYSDSEHRRRKIYYDHKSVLFPGAIWLIFCCGAATQRGSWPPHSWGFLGHTKRRSTVSRTPLDEWSARRRDLYLTTHDTRNTQISMPPVGFEHTIWAGGRPRTYALDRAVTGTGLGYTYINWIPVNGVDVTTNWRLRLKVWGCYGCDVQEHCLMWLRSV